MTVLSPAGVCGVLAAGMKHLGTAGLLAAALLVAGAGCRREPASSEREAVTPSKPLVVGAEILPPTPHLPSFDGGPIQFIDEDFNKLFPIFCLRHSMPLGEKAALWQSRYYGKWVRWTGRLMSFTANGITIKQGTRTVTFDISLWLEADQLALLQQMSLKVGDRVTYIGRLDAYDDIFQKLYLTHGSVLSRADVKPMLPPLR
jgi:hypothetical protein